ncbi:MAG: hypothetical protein HRU09_12930 [Oligoflexales bacterium]|nr:hypothetical protein [Oligoflexales bacterium]
MYWQAPFKLGLYPHRYLHIFALLLAVIIALSHNLSSRKYWENTYDKFILCGLMFLISLALTLIPFFAEGKFSQSFSSQWMVLAGVIGLVMLAWAYFRSTLSQFGALLLILSMSKVCYTTYFMPLRDHASLKMKMDAEKIASITKGKPLFLFDNTMLHDASLFYISRGRGEILNHHRGELLKDAFYIVSESRLNKFAGLPIAFQFNTKLTRWSQFDSSTLRERQYLVFNEVDLDKAISNKIGLQDLSSRAKL